MGSSRGSGSVERSIQIDVAQDPEQCKWNKCSHVRLVSMDTVGGQHIPRTRTHHKISVRLLSTGGTSPMANHGSHQRGSLFDDCVETTGSDVFNLGIYFPRHCTQCATVPVNSDLVRPAHRQGPPVCYSNTLGCRPCERNSPRATSDIASSLKSRTMPSVASNAEQAK